MSPERTTKFMLTADEVAEQYLRTSRKAVYEMVRRGQIPAARRVGRRLLFRTDQLIKWLESSRPPLLEGGSR